ncbi:uncharacterized protein LACBIDRAFT_317664 [Laccaria bicolor S238N-H82]|uniref:Predicted protein n=1 Tax=Laccaria bicolor (strain S238N-H82 / ATCC MYA-4686) TaxID=486041 RepID=B0E256_LACBS|nr:uncharacterized protein LACBIDRAFT_317664 [Laccaria bicolor S238N-H82]EDQ99065.1 predicted protein [Laccaria bicolor S238N-H82]|eukprot:XP_001890267.1 predicted protein [Laccaria bicolor S238N-H82]
MAPPDIPSLQQILFFTFFDNCVLIAGFTTLTYDYICTIKKEVTYAWSCPWSLGLVFFYLNRYLAFIDQSILLYIKFGVDCPKTCVRLYGIALATMSLGLLSCQAIIGLRTCGMWGGQRWIMVVLGIVLSISVIFAICITVLEIKSVTVEATPLGYFMVESTTLSLLVFIFILLVESVIGALTIVRACYYCKSSVLSFRFRYIQIAFHFQSNNLDLNGHDNFLAVVGTFGTIKSDGVSLTLLRQGFFIAFASFVSTSPNMKSTRFGYESFSLSALSLVNVLLLCIPSAGPFRMGIFWYENLQPVRPSRGSLARDSPTRVFHSIFGNRVMLLILQQRYRELQRSQNLHRSTTSPGFLTTVGFDWEWDTVPRDSIELGQRPEEREEEEDFAELSSD